MESPAPDGAAVQARRGRGALAADLGGRGPLRRRRRSDARRELRHLRAAAERHRRPPPRPRAERLAPGRARPLAPDAGLPTRSGSRATTTPGISTQNVVEKQLAAEGLTRHDLGREAFVERTWEWLEQTGRTIMGQFRRLGASLDYGRERFTLDDGYSRAVTAFFVRLWERGWIYRANRIVNWCPFHQTAISDLEVEHEDMDDVLTYVRYPFADGDGTRRHRDRDRAAGDDPRRRRGRRAPGRRALPRRDRPRGRRPVRRASRAGDRRRARRPGVRLGRAQDHAGPRPARLRDRTRPRAARADGDRSRRAG